MARICKVHVCSWELKMKRWGQKVNREEWESLIKMAKVPKREYSQGVIK
jgi:hypothetical protein